MSMRKSTRQELRKCREINRFLLGPAGALQPRDKHGNCICWFDFCRKPLVTDKSYAKDGDGQGSPVRGLTIHHKDGDHENDAPKNKALTHDPCHRSHHAKERWRKRKAA